MSSEIRNWLTQEPRPAKGVEGSQDLPPLFGPQQARTPAAPEQCRAPKPSSEGQRLFSKAFKAKRLSPNEAPVPDARQTPLQAASPASTGVSARQRLLDILRE